jgi:hypothetical protein
LVKILYEELQREMGLNLAKEEGFASLGISPRMRSLYFHLIYMSYENIVAFFLSHV